MGAKKQNDAVVSRRDFLKTGAAAGFGVMDRCGGQGQNRHGSSVVRGFIVVMVKNSQHHSGLTATALATLHKQCTEQAGN